MKCERIRLGYETMYSEQTTIQQTWDTIAHLVVPFRGSFWRDNSNENAINWHEQRNIYDSTAPMANNLLASSIHSALTNPAYQWMDVMMRNPKIRPIKKIMEWSQHAAEQMYYALYDSNFDLEANELYLDLPSYGTGFIMEEEVLKGGRFDSLNFQSVPVKEALFEEDHKGQPHVFYRQYRWTAAQIVSRFGLDKCPDKIKDLYATNQRSVIKHKVTFCIFPRPKMAKNVDSFSVLAPKERPFGAKFILHDSAEMIGDEQGYYEMPCFVPRWRKTNQSKYGNSPAMIALPDILTVNRFVELVLKSTEKVIDPSNLVTERGLLSNPNFQPAGFTVVRDIERSMKPYESKARFDVSSLERDQLQSSINRIFYVDQLQLKDSPAMTATEANIRYEMMQRLLGPTFGRMKHDFLNPMSERTFKILYRNGVIDPIPEEAYSEDGIPEIDFYYTGPMARAQRSDKINSAFAWAGQLAELANTHPRFEQVLDNINPDGFAEMTAKHGSIDSVLLNDAKTVKKIRADRSERQQVADAEATGNAMKAAGEGAQAVAAAPTGTGAENVVPIRAGTGGNEAGISPQG